MAKHQSERMFRWCLDTRRALQDVFVCGGAGVRKEALVMTPPSLSLDKMSTGGHLKQVIMTS